MSTVHRKGLGPDGSHKDCAATDAEYERKASTDADPAKSTEHHLPSTHRPENPMKGMTIGAAIALLVAVLMAGSPFLFYGTSANSDSGEAAWVFLFVTIPIGVFMGLVALMLLIIVSIIGIVRARGTSTVRLTIAILAPILMILPTGLLIAAFVNAWVTSIWALILTAMILVGIVLAVITGFTPRAERLAAGGSAA